MAPGLGENGAGFVRGLLCCLWFYFVDLVFEMFYMSIGLLLVLFSVRYWCRSDRPNTDADGAARTCPSVRAFP